MAARQDMTKSSMSQKKGPDALERFQLYLEAPFAPEKREALKAKRDDFTSGGAFSGDLGFGTGGVRAIVGDGTNRLNTPNIARLTSALALAFELEKELITLLLILEAGRIIGLDKVEIEIPFWHRRGTFIGCPEEKVAGACGHAFLPDQLILPDVVAAFLGRHIGPFHDLL